MALSRRSHLLDDETVSGNRYGRHPRRDQLPIRLAMHGDLLRDAAFRKPCSPFAGIPDPRDQPPLGLLAGDPGAEMWQQPRCRTVEKGRLKPGGEDIAAEIDAGAADEPIGIGK